MECKNVRHMSSLFKHCNKLTKLPDISKWDIRNVTDLKFLFYK